MTKSFTHHEQATAIKGATFLLRMRSQTVSVSVGLYSKKTSIQTPNLAF
jgi:hypothetical protein